MDPENPRAATREAREEVGRVLPALQEGQASARRAAAAERKLAPAATDPFHQQSAGARAATGATSSAAAQQALSLDVVKHDMRFGSHFSRNLDFHQGDLFSRSSGKVKKCGKKQQEVPDFSASQVVRLS